MGSTIAMDTTSREIVNAELADELATVRRAQRGERAAFATLYDQHYQPIYTYLYYRVDDVETAKELTSQVFVRMVEKINSFKSRGRPFLAWLYTIARNLLTDHYRKNKQATLLPMDERLPAEKHLPEADAESHFAEDCLRVALALLTDIQRQVIIGKFIEDRSNRDVAALLERTEGSIKSLQHRALAALRRAIEKEGCYET